MRSEGAIRHEIASLEEEIPLMRRKTAQVLAQQRVETLRWVLGEESELDQLVREMQKGGQ